MHNNVKHVWSYGRDMGLMGSHVEGHDAECADTSILIMLDSV